MSQNNVQLGVALLCGGASMGLLISLTNTTPIVALVFAIVVGGGVLIALGSQSAPQAEEAPKHSKKQQQPKKENKKSAVASPKPPKSPKLEPAETPETPSKKKKKGKKPGGTPITSPVTPQQQVKQKATPKVEEDKEEKETITKTQLRKLKKKEAEEKAKAAELAKKAAEQKREAAHQKKQQAKARKAAQKTSQPPTETKTPKSETKTPKSETKPETKEASRELEAGWETPTNRKSRGGKDGKETKKYSFEPVVIDMKVPPRFHAAVIGKEGSQLRQLTQELDVHITMPKRESRDDVILIKGMVDNVKMAKRAIEEIVAKGFSTVTHPDFIAKQFTLTSPGQLGIVFGKRGANLGLIAEATKAKIQMPERDSGDLKLTITGKEQQIDEAIAIIQELLDQGYTKITHPGWISEEVEVVPAAIGSIIGKDGATIRKLSSDYKVRIETPRRDDATAKSDAVTIKGLPRNIAKTKAAIAEIVASLEAPTEQEVPDPLWQEDVQEISW